MADFAMKIRHALVDQNMNVSDLARRTGYSPQYLHSLLKGEKRWNEESMRRVCEVLGFEIMLVKRNEVDINGQVAN